MPKRKSQSKGIPPPDARRIWIPARATPPDEKLPDEVADAVHAFFDYLTSSKGHGGGGVTAARPGSGQWTVVAGFMLLRHAEDVRTDPTDTSAADGFRDSREASSTVDGDGRSRGTNDAKGGKWVDITLCSLASGVKCLGGSFADDPTPPVGTTPNFQGTQGRATRNTPGTSWSERDAQVVDMHAEILARRELESLLLREMRVLIARHRGKALEHGGNKDDGEERDPQPEPMLLELVIPFANPADPLRDERKRPYFRLKKGTQLVLYTSHAPCGAASDAAHVRRLDAEDAMIRETLTKWNLYPSDEAPQDDQPENEVGENGNQVRPSDDLSSTSEEQVSAFRLGKTQDIPPVVKKPSRADAPPTEAYSCSDKLGRAQWLGFQGGRLARFMRRPVRLDELVVGEDYEEACLRKIFGRGEGYSRVQEVTRVLEGQQGSGRRWLEGLEKDEPCRIRETTRRFRYGRQAATPIASSTPRIPEDVKLAEIRHLPLPLLRDILLPPPAGPSPFPVALAWHAHSIPQAIGPNGRLSGVTRDKRTKEWGDNSVARVARGRMWHEFEDLARDYEQAFGPLEGDVKMKGGPGWREASAWMEERGPYARWLART
jgi:hypothetical protein